MSQPTLLHLMRHGEPELTGRMLGTTDSLVTQDGIAACLRRSEDLAIRRIVTSDLARTQKCAEAIGGARRVAVTVDPRWRELDFGEWDGLRAAEVDQAALARFWDDPDAAPPPGGERWSDLVARVTEALARRGEGPTLVVTHGGAMRAALTALCGFDARQVWAFDLPYAAVLSVHVWPAGGQIVGLRT